MQYQYNQIIEPIRITGIRENYLKGVNIYDHTIDYTILSENDFITIQKRINEKRFVSKYILNLNGELQNLIGLFITKLYIYLIYNKDTSKTWTAYPRFSNSLEIQVIEDTLEFIKRFQKIKVQNNTFLNFEENIKIRIKYAKEIIIKHFSKLLDSNDFEKLAYISAFRTIKWNKLIPLLLDDQINEIYLDRINEPLYIDHAIFGRCDTKIKLSNSEIDSFISRLRIDNDLSLNKINPSLKVDFSNVFFKTRITVDIEPFVDSKVAIIIRRFKNRAYNIIDLIELGTISPEQVSLILIFIYLRKSVTISGIPGSGKTTLLNAIDQLIPNNWRRIYIEDVRESNLFNAKQLRIKVRQFDSVGYLKTKRTETIKVLHRSPDILILGEIQTEEHSNALLEALLSGIQVLHTIHSKNIEELLFRLNKQHKIDKETLNSLGIIIQMDKPYKEKAIRKVVQLATVENNKISYISKELNISDIFENLSKSQKAYLKSIYLELVELLYKEKRFILLKQKIELILQKLDVLI